MPDQNPTPGETWEMRDNHGRVTRGIVAEISTNITTLVALTGARIRVPSSRLPQQWVFVAAPPKTSLTCSRCKQPGILRYQRDTTPDFVCPKHVPVGVIATVHTPGERVLPAERAPAPKNVIVCPHCGNADPVEDKRLGRLDLGQFGWWTCMLCSSRWGLIAEPSTDTDNRGRWYGATLADLYNTMLEQNANMTRIEMSRSAWGVLSSACRRKEIDAIMTIHDAVIPDSGFEVGTFYEVPIFMVASLSDGAVLVRAPNAGSGSAISPRRPVQRIGGVGNRSGVVGEGDGRTLDRLYDPQEARTGMLRRTTTEVRRTIISRPTDQTKPKEGARYFHRKTGNAITILRVEDSDQGWSVAYQENSYTGNHIGHAPCILWMNDFLQEFVPHVDARFSDPPPVVPTGVALTIGEEWFAYEADEYVKIVSTDYRRMIAVVRGGSTGRTRNVPIAEFADESRLKKVVRTTAHQRLMGDDDF